MRNFDEMLAELDEARMWEQALDERAVSADLDRGRPDRRRVRGHRRDHRPQVAVAARALDGRGRARRGRRLAHGPPGGLRHPRAARRARPRPRPGRRVECDLGEAGTARVRRVGARAAAPALHRARLRPVAGARSDRAAGRLAPRAARRLRLPPRQRAAPELDQAARILAAADCYAAMREARPHRPALDAPAAEAELLREAKEGRLDPDAVDAVLTAAGHRVAKRPRELPAGLTPRELEVLLVLVRGAVEPGDRRRSRHLRQDRRAPRPARLREGRRPQPGRRDALGLRARPRSHRIGRSPDAPPVRQAQILASPLGVERRRRERKEEQR